MAPIIAVFMSLISLMSLISESPQQQGESIPLPPVDDGVSRSFLDVAKRTIPLKMTAPQGAFRLPRRAPRAAPVPALEAMTDVEEQRRISRDDKDLLRSVQAVNRQLLLREINDLLRSLQDEDTLRRIPRTVSNLLGSMKAPNTQRHIPSDVNGLLRILSPPVADQDTASFIVRRKRRDIREQLWGSRPGSRPSPRPGQGPGSRTSTTRDPRASTSSPPTSRSSQGPGGAAFRRPAPHRSNSLGELRDDLRVHGRDRDQLRRRWKIEDASKRVANIHG